MLVHGTNVLALHCFTLFSVAFLTSQASKTGPSLNATKQFITGMPQSKTMPRPSSNKNNSVIRRTAGGTSGAPLSGVSSAFHSNVVVIGNNGKSQTKLLEETSLLLPEILADLTAKVSRLSRMESLVEELLADKRLQKVGMHEAVKRSWGIAWGKG